ncbi:MAG TPA: hypothetical protein VJW51_03260 [Candidatus Acidoferrales bacterium]|nr:hypothetical protein [Candidatus Acidoferrales bacterium]
MNEKISESTRGLLRQALPPMGHSELRRDLWPQMLRRLEAPPARVPWFDWVLVALVAIWALASPQMIPILLFHL